MNILIADDLPANLKLLRAQLEAEGFTVTEAADGLEALAALERVHVDAVISDILMPRMDGYRLCGEIRRNEKWRCLPVIFYTATYTSPSDEKLALEVGADRYLRKPAGADEILAVLRELLRPGIPHPSHTPASLDETVVLKEYNERLIAKLEEKHIELLVRAAAVDTADNAIVVTDVRGIITWTNPAFTSLTGYTAAEAVGQNMRLVQSGEHPPSFYKEFWGTILSGQSWRGEFANRRKDGMLYYDEHTVTPVRSAGRGISHFIGIMHDVTARKRAAAESARLAAIVESSDDAIIGHDLHGVVTSWNRGAHKLYGYSAAEMLGQTCLRLVPLELREEAADITSRIGRGESVHHYETVRVARDGRKVDVAISVSPIRDDASKIVGASKVARDISGRRSAEAALRQTRERLILATDSAKIGIWDWDIVANQLTWDKRMYALYGLREQDFSGAFDAWQKGLHPEDRQGGEAAVAAAIAGVKELDFEFRVCWPDGEVRHIKAYANTQRAADGSAVRMIGVNWDITEQKRLEEQYRQTQKMEAIGTLAGGIAHDFNNILAAINGYTELALMEVGDQPAKDHMQAVLSGAARATDLVRQILAFSRHQQQERKVAQLGTVVTEALKLLRASVPATIEIQTSLVVNVPNVLVDSSQIHQIIMNLGTNAAHAMRHGPGKLLVALKPFQVDAELAETRPSLRPGLYVLLSVSDTGHGMDTATMARIFEPFYTTKGPGEGTGLGLSVVHGIMQSHEGTVTVYSHPGEGTAFHLYFPAHAGEIAPLSGNSHAVRRGHGQRILYLDDEAPLARLGEKILTKLGYTVDAYTNPREALARIEATPEAYDLVMTDQMMPGMMGTDVAQIIHSMRPDLPIVLITGYTATLTPERIGALGISKLLLKPLSIESLGTLVHQVLTETPKEAVLCH